MKARIQVCGEWNFVDGGKVRWMEYIDGRIMAWRKHRAKVVIKSYGDLDRSDVRDFYLSVEAPTEQIERIVRAALGEWEP